MVKYYIMKISLKRKLAVILAVCVFFANALPSFAENAPAAGAFYGSSAVPAGASAADAAYTAASAADAVASDSGATFPKGFGKPKITDFRVIDGNVYITVKGSHGSMRYGVRSGKRIDALAGDGESRYGRTGGELIIVKPQNGESGFYAVEEVKE